VFFICEEQVHKVIINPVQCLDRGDLIFLLWCCLWGYICDDSTLMGSPGKFFV